MTPKLTFKLEGSGAPLVSRPPLIVALCAFYPHDTDSESLRAALRGLGAELVVLTPLHGKWLSPDGGEPRAIEPLPRLWEEHKIAPPERGGPPLTILFFDEQMRLGLRKVADAPVPIEETLLAAIREAKRAIHGVTRRELLAGSLIAGLAAALAQACAAVAPKVEIPAAPPPEKVPEQLVDLTLNVNGKPRAIRVETRVTLLDALRERLALTGSKKGCDMGQCGACTVLIDGVRMNSCLQLACMNEGREITTIEGLAKEDGTLHPMQQAFVDCDGLQCGYCTPGQILSAIGMLKEGTPKDDAELRENMSGNLCRCGAYPNIVAAIHQAQTSAGG